MSTENQEYGVIQNQLYGYENGGANPRQNALLYQQQNDAEQAAISALAGGRRKRRTRSRRGGQAAGTEMEVPSFVQVGPATSPLNPTSASVAGNQAALDAQVAACNDCYATGTCDQTIGCPQQGGRRTRRRTKAKSGKTRPYKLSSRRVKKSPFRTLASARKTLKAYRAGRKIGFTQKSSLRSMGLIKRSDGRYALGTKYG